MLYLVLIFGLLSRKWVAIWDIMLGVDGCHPIGISGSFSNSMGNGSSNKTKTRKIKNSSKHRIEDRIESEMGKIIRK